MVDDDEDDLYFIKAAILSNIPNCIVKCFIHGKQLLDSLTEFDKELPNFILMDLNMPVLNGKETLKLLRKNSIINHIPVIIFSTSTCASEKANCLQFGADNYLSKPASSNVYDEIMQRLKRDYIDQVTVFNTPL